MKFKAMLAVILVSSLAARADLWSEDLDKAASWAKAQNKYVLVDFTGSDWCGWCKRLDKEVFAKKEFKDFAKANLVCVSIDFPRNKPQSQELMQRNYKLQEKFEVTGYPTIFLLSPEGEVVARTGYKAGGAEEYVKHLQEFIEQHKKPAPESP